MFRYTLLFALVCLLVLSACTYRDDFKSIPQEVTGYRPIYYDSSNNFSDQIFSTNPKPIVNPGNIYVYKMYLFVGEPGEGVHVFDNSDPSAPIPFSFINIPHNYNIAIRDTVLYADTYIGIVSISIAKFPQIRLLQYIRDQYKIPNLPFEQDMRWNRRFNESRTYFECIDSDKGLVVGWERTTIEKPKCYK